MSVNLLFDGRAFLLGVDAQILFKQGKSSFYAIDNFILLFSFDKYNGLYDTARIIIVTVILRFNVQGIRVYLLLPHRAAARIDRDTVFVPIAV